MSLFAALAAAGLLARAAAAGPTLPSLGGTAVSGDVQATADHFTYEVGTGRVLLEGNVVVRRGAVVLRARSATWDPATNEVRAAGDVLLMDPTRVISATAVRAIMGGDVEAEEVLAFVKDRPVDLSGLRTPAEARRAGRNRVTFSGERLTGSVEGRLRLTHARLTLCDCPGGGTPSWEVRAREADVIPGKRAILREAAVRIHGRPVPLLALPWLYLPIGERQSGLLLPLLGSTGASGFSIAEPLYLTLGRSADATLTAEYAFGRDRAKVGEGKPAVRGPGARLELRWVPAEAAEGRMELAWLHDLDAEPGGEAGDRWGLTAAHGQRVGATTLAAHLQLAGDPVWVRDTTSDVLGRRVPYRRSDLLASHRGGAVVTEAVASYLQPLQPEDARPFERYGPLGADLGLSSRWGLASATLVPVSVGPLRLSARTGAARFGPAGQDVDEAGRPAATRADARAEVAAPVLVGGAVTVAPFVRGAVLGYAYDAALDPTATAWGIGGAIVETEVSRRYGGLRHAISPRLEWRAGTGAVGDPLASPSYDALDRSTAGAPFLLSAVPGAFQQLRAAIETRLEARGADLVRAELGQDLDLRAGRLAETFTAVAVAAGPVRADARASFFADGRGVAVPEPPGEIRVLPSRLDDFTELRASLSILDRRGDGVRAGFFSVGPGGSERLVGGIDPLFDVRPAALAAASSATAGVRASAGSARFAYDALFPGRASLVPLCEGEGTRRVAPLHVQQHAASVAWDSPCRCFRIALVAHVTDCGEVSYRASIDLTGLANALTR